MLFAMLHCGTFFVQLQHRPRVAQGKGKSAAVTITSDTLFLQSAQSHKQRPGNLYKTPGVPVQLVQNSPCQPSNFVKSAACIQMSRIFPSKFSLLRRTTSLSVLTCTASKKASIGARNFAIASIAAVKSSASLAFEMAASAVSSAAKSSFSSGTSAYFTSGPKEYSTPSFSSAWVRMLLALLKP